MAHVLVIGGGIAGLSAAYTLRRLGSRVTLVEAEPRFGGKLLTEHARELLIDAGPDSFLSSKPAALQLITQLGLQQRIVNTRSDGGGTFILSDGRLRPLPEGLTMLVPADLRSIAATPLLSPLGKLRMALDYLIPARADPADESIGAFVRRRVGRQAFERLAEPLLSGIYAGDADQLSLLATIPRFRDIERRHGGLIRGALAQRRQAASTSATRASADLPTSYPADRPAAAVSGQSAPTTADPIPSSTRTYTPFVTLAGGLGELVDALVLSLADADLRTTVAVSALHQSSTGYCADLSDGSAVRADAVVLATPAFAAAELLAPLSPALADELNGIAYVSTATLSLAFRASALADRPIGRGFVIPRREGRTLTAVTWTSNKFAGRAPNDVALLRGFVGRAGNEEPAFLPDDELIALALSELRQIFSIRAEPTFARVYRWPRAMPQYVLGHPERLARIDALLTQVPGLTLIGNAYRGVGIPDVIRDATERATALTNALSSRSASAVVPVQS